MVAKKHEQAKTSRSERPRRRHLDDGSFVWLPPVSCCISNIGGGGGGCGGIIIISSSVIIIIIFIIGIIPLIERIKTTPM